MNAVGPVMVVGASVVVCVDERVKKSVIMQHSMMGVGIRKQQQASTTPPAPHTHTFRHYLEALLIGWPQIQKRWLKADMHTPPQHRLSRPSFATTPCAGFVLASVFLTVCSARGLA